MPRILKRRSDAISRDPTDSPSEDELHPPTQRRRRLSSSSSPSPSPTAAVSDRDDSTHEASGTTNTATLVRNLVRLALATEYTRQPLRRADISAKIFRDTNAGRRFREVFEAAQKVLRGTFGMELREIPAREKTSLKDRRAAATQTKAASSAAAASRAWILVSTLPAAYKSENRVVAPARAPSAHAEAAYTGLYSFVLALIYLNNGCLSEGKLERYLKRVNAELQTPAGALDKVLKRMEREGYLERRRDTSSGEEVVEFVVGGRGKIEVGIKGVEGLVRSVYGWGAMGLPDGAGVKIEEEELEARLARSLGLKVAARKGPDASTAAQGSEDELGEMAATTVATAVDDENPGPSRSARRRPRRTARDDDDDDDDI